MTRGPTHKQGTNPGNGGTETIFDTSTWKNGPSVKIGRHQLFVYVTAQAVTVNYLARAKGGTWRTIATYTVASGDSADYNWMAVGFEQKGTIVCGGTAPTLYQVSYNPISDEMAEP
jgi:hypothetical protein